MVLPNAVVWLAGAGLLGLGAVAGFAAARSRARLGGRFMRHRCNGVTVWDGAIAGEGAGAEVSLYLVVKRRRAVIAAVAQPGVDAPAPS